MSGARTPGPRQRRYAQSLARGFARADGMMQCAVRFDPEMFLAIRRRALAARHSFAEEVRLLVEWGLEVTDE